MCDYLQKPQNQNRPKTIDKESIVILRRLVLLLLPVIIFSGSINYVQAQGFNDFIKPVTDNTDKVIGYQFSISDLMDRHNQLAQDVDIDFNDGASTAEFAQIVSHINRSLDLTPDQVARLNQWDVYLWINQAPEELGFGPGTAGTLTYEENRLDVIIYSNDPHSLEVLNPEIGSVLGHELSHAWFDTILAGYNRELYTEQGVEANVDLEFIFNTRHGVEGYADFYIVSIGGKSYNLIYFHEVLATWMEYSLVNGIEEPLNAYIQAVPPGLRHPVDPFGDFQQLNEFVRLLNVNKYDAFVYLGSLLDDNYLALISQELTNNDYGIYGEIIISALQNPEIQDLDTDFVKGFVYTLIRTEAMHLFKYSSRGVPIYRQVFTDVDQQVTEPPSFSLSHFYGVPINQQFNTAAHDSDGAIPFTSSQDVMNYVNQLQQGSAMPISNLPPEQRSIVYSYARNEFFHVMDSYTNGVATEVSLNPKYIGQDSIIRSDLDLAGYNQLRFEWEALHYYLAYGIHPIPYYWGGGFDALYFAEYDMAKVGISVEKLPALNFLFNLYSSKQYGRYAEGLITASNAPELEEISQQLILKINEIMESDNQDQKYRVGQILSILYQRVYMPIQISPEELGSNFQFLVDTVDYESRSEYSDFIEYVAGGY